MSCDGFVLREPARGNREGIKLYRIQHYSFSAMAEDNVVVELIA